MYIRQYVNFNEGNEGKQWML